MLKFNQEVLHNPPYDYGDCTRAVVYTLAQENLRLPHPINYDNPKTWNMVFFKKLEEKGYALDFFPKGHWPRFVGRSGISPRGIRHLVVWDRKTNTMFHDPHPSREGLVPGTEDGWFILRKE